MLMLRTNWQGKRSNSKTSVLRYQPNAVFAVAGTRQSHTIIPPADRAGGFDFRFDLRGTIMGNDVCDFVIANLCAYLDSELDPDLQKTVENHLANCTGCGEALNSIEDYDRQLTREWRDSAPLPSSFAFDQAVDAVMAALPATPAHAAAFHPRRVHSRARWMRFA